MKYFYMILPIAFTLMTIRILWNNYERLFKGVEAIDPDAKEIKKIQKLQVQNQQHQAEKHDYQVQKTAG